MRISKIALVSAAMVLSAGSLQAQTVTNCETATQGAMGGANCQTTTDLTATVPYLAQITKNITSAVLPAATVANMTSGYSDAVAGPTLNIKANFVWTLTASMGGFAQVIAQGVTWNKPNVDLEISNVASGDSWMTFASSRALATSQQQTNTQDVPTRFRVAYRWEKDLPGSYSATVTYTLTAP